MYPRPSTLRPEKAFINIIKLGIIFFITELDSRRVWVGPPAPKVPKVPKVLGSDSKPHLESRFCTILISSQEGCLINWFAW